MEPLKSIYIHIPFCSSICPFCDFYKISSRDYSLQEHFIQKLIKELLSLKDRFYLNEIETIYIGGGTPSIIDRKFFIELLNAIREEILEDTNNFKEFTLEINPELINKDFLQLISDYGVNRLSIGIQSHNNYILQLLGRRNREKDNINGLETVNLFWSGRFSLDFMYGVPGQSLESVNNDIEFIKKYNPHHFSLYQLTIEENTFFYDHPQNLPSDEDIEKFWIYYINSLKESYYRYEVSNFCRDGFISHHNLNYWRINNHIGLGPSAVGTIIFKDGTSRRESHLPSIKEYIKSNQYGLEVSHISKEDSIIEFLMMSLRLSSGFTYSSFFNRFYLDFNQLFPKTIQWAINNELITISKLRIRPLEKGLNLLNSLIIEFMNELNI